MKLSIGQASNILGISKDTLRYYDKIGILKPEIDTTNGYRYYLLKHLEKLELILGIKYLGVSLADIKNTIESEDINEYNALISRQEKNIKERIKELQALEEHFKNTKKILNTIINFTNEYNFTKLNIIEENYNLYGIDVKNLLNSDFYTKETTSLEKELISLKEEPYLYINNIVHNEYIIEDDSTVYMKENEKILELIRKYTEENNLIIMKKSIKDKFVCTNFYGTIKEINKYIISLNKYFKCTENNTVYIAYEFYLPKKDDKVLYFVNINLKVNK